MPLYVHRCDDHGVFEAFRPMAECSDDAPCPECGKASAKRITLPRLSIKTASESADASVKRLMGDGKPVRRGEQFFDNPWTQERVRLTGSKKNREDQVVRSVLDSPMAKNRAKKGRPIQKSDISVPNL